MSRNEQGTSEPAASTQYSREGHVVLVQPETSDVPAAGEQTQIRQKQMSLFQKLIGCCLGRQTRRGNSNLNNKSNNNNNETTSEVSSEDERSAQYSDRTPNDLNSSGDKDRRRKKTTYKISYEEEQAEEERSKNSSKNRKKKSKEDSKNNNNTTRLGHSNGQSDRNSESSTIGRSAAYSPPLYRGSSFSTKTHNYDFDISNFTVDSVFLFGKQLQLILLITEQRYEIDYEACSSQDPYELNRRNLVVLSSSSSTTTQKIGMGNSSSSAKYDRTSEDYLMKYFQRRQVYFSRFMNGGILVDANAWPNLVPECIVQHIARKAGSSARRESIIDTSCCVGQFSIAFATYINSVIAIENNPSRIASAQQNAEIYEINCCKYVQGERIAFDGGIQFFREAEFMDPKFQIGANLSDCIFIAPHLQSSRIDNPNQSNDKSYFEQKEFYDNIRLQLKKALQIAPQVIMFTPRNVKIVEIVDAFTEAIKENLTKVKKCSMQIEKYFVNEHLKYLCFYFGDFNKTNCDLSSQGEFKYINSLVEKCYSMNQDPSEKKRLAKLKQSPQSPVQQPQTQTSGQQQQFKSPTTFNSTTTKLPQQSFQTPQQQQQQIIRQKPIRIHQEIFNELGKFQLLNIACRFNSYFKSESMRISATSVQKYKQTSALQSLFYEYLVHHNFLSSERVAYITSKSLYTNSNVSSTTNRMFNFTSEIRQDPHSSELRNLRGSSILFQPTNHTRRSILQKNLLHSQKSFSGGQSRFRGIPSDLPESNSSSNNSTESHKKTNKQININNFKNNQNTKDFQQTQIQNGQDQPDHPSSLSSAGTQSYPNTKIDESTPSDRTFSMGSNFEGLNNQIAFENRSNFRETCRVFQNGQDKQQQSILARRNPKNSQVGSSLLFAMGILNQRSKSEHSSVAAASIDMKSMLFMQNPRNDSDLKEGVQTEGTPRITTEDEPHQIYSETESEIEYSEGWSYSKNQLNVSGNTHKISFLAGRGNMKSDSRVFDEANLAGGSSSSRNRATDLILKSQLSNASGAWSQNQNMMMVENESELVIVFHSTFFDNSLPDKVTPFRPTGITEITTIANSTQKEAEYSAAQPEDKRQKVSSSPISTQLPLSPQANSY